ncbi:hypothetical protein ACJJTC_012818 [Scirpophaga incertulas]
MDGSEKLKPLVIGKAMKPRCFKGVKSFPTDYRANKKAWMTTELFNNWLLTINGDMKRQKRKILLFLDNCTVHNNDEEPAMEPLVDISGVSFSDFIQVDENVAVSGSLTDGEILSATDTQSNDEDEDDTSEPLAEVSVKEARSSFDTLKSFCLQNESDEKAFQALFLLKKVIEQCEQQNCALKQTSITKFFRKIN